MPSKVPAPADRGDRRTEAAHFVEIGKIGPYQRTKAGGDIGERRRFLARQYHCNDSRYHDGHEYRHSNAKAGNEIGYPMNHKGDNGRRHQSFRPQLAFDEQKNDTNVGMTAPPTLTASMVPFPWLTPGTA